MVRMYSYFRQSMEESVVVVVGYVKQLNISIFLPRVCVFNVRYITYP